MVKNEQERKRIGARIAEIRKDIVWTNDRGWKQQGMTQRELGARCGLADSHIARIEKGRYSVGFDTLQAIAEGLNCTVEIVPRQEAKQEAYPQPLPKGGE